MLGWIKVVAAVAMLVGMAVVVWKFKWIILCSVLVFTLVLMGSNALYHRYTGRDMAIYTRIMKEDK
jgi:LPS O-antigen subunit length determinant protein (WzzB/FepE family)